MGCRLVGEPGGIHPPYLRDRFRLDHGFRSHVIYTAEHGIPYSIFQGRVVEPGEPEWLPDDRDVVDLYLEMIRTRFECGHWEWENEIPDGLVVDFLVCKRCREVGEYAGRLRADRKNMYGVTFGWFPPREEQHGD